MAMNRSAVFFLLLSGTAIANADNAALTTGGLPKMMKAHPSIRMAAETVDLFVHKNTIETVCTFTFVNDGPACTVNMGFPDFGLWAYASTPKPPRSMFKKFQSFVDGKSVKTKLIPGALPGEQWQTKLVSFQAKSKRIIRETYTTELGGVADQETLGAASYLLHTGSSWKGNIGRAVVTVTFAPDSELIPPFVIDPDAIKSHSTLMAHMAKPGAIVSTSRIKPQISGASLIFTRENWRPTKEDDILVFFHYPRSATKR
jgi:hypothetical protein